MQKALIILGAAIMLVGLLWPLLSKLPLGQLPGDFVIDRPGFRFYFPLTTMLIVSAVLSLMLYFLKK